MKPRWKQLLDSNDWLAIENEWMDFDRTGRAAVLDEARRIVPKERVEDGIEKIEVYLTPDKVPDKFRIAARLLHAGELEGSLMDDPMSDAQIWYAQVRPDIEEQLHEILAAVPPEDRDKPLTQAGHASVALEALAALDGVTRLAVHEATDAEDERYIREVIGDVARHVFFAGQHSAVALWKPYERKAAERLGQDRFNDHNEGRDEANAQKRQEALERKAIAAPIWEKRAREKHHEGRTARAKFVAKEVNKLIPKPISWWTILAYFPKE